MITSDGIINTFAGGGYDSLMANDGAPPTAIDLAGWDQRNGVALTPNGRLILTNQSTATLHEVTPMFPSIGTSNITIPSGNGMKLYVFDPTGRHLETRHALTGATLFTFGYDSDGRLVTVTDANNNVTTINRDGSGNPTSVAAPFGQITTLSLDTNGYLDEVSNPVSETVQFGYTADGLLTTVTDPKLQDDTVTYNSAGQVTRVDDPAGGFIIVTRAEIPNGHEVSVTTAEGRVSTYRIETLSTGNNRRTTIGANGLAVETDALNGNKYNNVSGWNGYNINPQP